MFRRNLSPPTTFSKSKPSENLVTKVSRTLCSKLCQQKEKYLNKGIRELDEGFKGINERKKKDGGYYIPKKWLPVEFQVAVPLVY
jgi:hypothetical protein